MKIETLKKISKLSDRIINLFDTAPDLTRGDFQSVIGAVILEAYELGRKAGKMKTLELKFVGIDSWNRPIFKDVNNKRDYYGATDILFDYEDTAELVLNKISPKHITFFGNSFNCEPMGTPVSGEIKFINPNI